LIMTSLKYPLLFAWGLALLSMVIFVIRSHPFIRRKKDSTLNLSEAIYAASLLGSAGLVFSSLLQTLAVDFDITQKFYPDRFWVTLITSGSLISLAGVALFILFFVTARGLSTLFFFKREPLIEFDANTISYSVLRAGLLLSLSFLFSPFCQPIYQNLLPAITTPFYQ
jgi:hypothetical protein